jgi:acyl-CoA reductase-like NAD-dependent aldehyde dehydrogenase
MAAYRRMGDAGATRLGRHQPAAPRARDVRVQALVEANMDALAHMLSSEHGKVIADSKGDIQRGLEVIEFAAASRMC